MTELASVEALDMADELREALGALDLLGFSVRVVQDAIANALPCYWERRAETFELVRPRPGDYLGRASAAEMAELDQRNAELALNCRRHAALLRGEVPTHER